MCIASAVHERLQSPPNGIERREDVVESAAILGRTHPQEEIQKTQKLEVAASAGVGKVVLQTGDTDTTYFLNCTSNFWDRPLVRLRAHFSHG
jgi:hypothetical protein